MHRRFLSSQFFFPLLFFLGDSRFSGIGLLFRDRTRHLQFIDPATLLISRFLVRFRLSVNPFNSSIKRCITHLCPLFEKTDEICFYLCSDFRFLFFCFFGLFNLLRSRCLHESKNFFPNRLFNLQSLLSGQHIGGNQRIGSAFHESNALPIYLFFRLHRNFPTSIFVLSHRQHGLTTLTFYFKLLCNRPCLNSGNLERQLFGNALSLFPVAGIHLLLLRPLLDQHIYLALGARLQGLFFIKHIIVESLFPHIVRLGRIVRNRSVFPALLPGLYGWVFP